MLYHATAFRRGVHTKFPTNSQSFYNETRQVQFISIHLHSSRLCMLFYFTLCGPANTYFYLRHFVNEHSVSKSIVLHLVLCICVELGHVLFDIPIPTKNLTTSHMCPQSKSKYYVPFKVPLKTHMIALLYSADSTDRLCLQRWIQLIKPDGAFFRDHMLDNKTKLSVHNAEISLRATNIENTFISYTL